jgi:hypothetical protein
MTSLLPLSLGMRDGSVLTGDCCRRRFRRVKVLYLQGFRLTR